MERQVRGVRRLEHARRGGGAHRAQGVGGGRGKLAFVGLEGAQDAPPRRLSGLAEFDRACGGGLVAGSALLVGGDPGIGKSTLLLQVAAALAQGKGGQKLDCAYVSGEELLDQVRLRAERLGIKAAPVQLAAATSIRDIAGALDRADAPHFVVVDSIQTMYLDTLDSAPGTVAQVRASAQELIRLAKARGFTVMLVGHVTKDGLIAGPRVLEHMVDTVLYFEGERGHQFRILRAVKNRFGPTDEIGVFEMTDAGLAEVPNPSALFLGERQTPVAGAAVFAGIEGTRPMLVEIQALVAPSSLRHAAARRRGLGRQPARHGAGGARGALRRRVRRARHLSQCRRRLAHRRAGGRPRRRRGAGLGAQFRAGAGRHGRVRRDRPLGRGAAGGPERRAAQGGGEARLSPRRWCRRGAAAAQAIRASSSTASTTFASWSRGSSRRRGGRSARAGSAMNALDIFVIAIVILSGLFAFARGFVRECLSIASWIGATGAALYATPYLRPYAEHYVPKGAVADATAAGAAFIVTLIVLTLIAGTISRHVQRSSLSALDRTLGLMFGLMRGALLVAIGFLALSFVLPPGTERPQWIAQSRTAPLFAAATGSLARLVPEPFRRSATQFNPQDHLESEFQNAIRAYAIPTPQVPEGPPGGAGPTQEEQQRLKELFQRYGGGEAAQDPALDRVIRTGPGGQ